MCSVTPDDLRAQAADRVIELLCGQDRHAVSRNWWEDDAVIWTGLALAAIDPVSTVRATCPSVLRSLAELTSAPDLADQPDVVQLSIHRIADAGWSLSGPNSGKTVAATLLLASFVAGSVYLGPATRRARWFCRASTR